MKNFLLKAQIIKMYGGNLAFARKVGVHEGCVSQVIHGRRRLQPEEARKWCRLLGCNAVDAGFSEESGQETGSEGAELRARNSGNLT